MSLVKAWNQFWFTPAEPETIAVVRILVGTMLVYSHVVWAIGTDAFFGPQSWLNAETVASIHDHWAAWSPLWLIDNSPALIGGLHAFATINALCLACGFMSRTTSICALVLHLAYVHRNPAALYGFDQVIGFLCLYLPIADSGKCYSLDRWLGAPSAKLPTADVATNIAQRLMQLHLCVLYLFAGVSKLKGATWWNGSALWGAIANQEYQTIDMTWLVDWPIIINLLTHVTIVWEVSYCALIWNRHTRPFVLLIGLGVHLGIGCCFGMMTFGLAMLVANCAFMDSKLIRTRIQQMQAFFAEVINSKPAPQCQ